MLQMENGTNKNLITTEAQLCWYYV